MVIGPEVVVKVLFRVIAVAVKETPKAELMETAPLKVVVPAPADCVKEAALNVVNVRLFALAIVVAPIGVTPPTTPENKMFHPPPAVRPQRAQRRSATRASGCSSLGHRRAQADRASALIHRSGSWKSASRIRPHGIGFRKHNGENFLSRFS